MLREITMSSDKLWKRIGYRVESYAPLAEAARFDAAAYAALCRYQRLCAAEKNPEILHSQAYGWLIRDTSSEPASAQA